MQAVTNPAPDQGVWAIDDAVVRLRAWGGDRVFELPPPPIRTSLILGSQPECDLVLDDPAGFISRRHARLEWEQGAWMVHDLGSTNGIAQDGERRLSVQLAPGTELGLGEIRLVAESPKLDRLRAFLSRVLGWERDRIAEVDRGLRAIRELATRRAGLALCGAGDLTSVARRIHGLAMGEERPFVTSTTDGLPALARAGIGTLCLYADSLPCDFGELAKALNAEGSKTRIVVCAPGRDIATEAMASLDRTSTIELPPLGARASELDRIITEYAEDAVVALGAKDTGFREHELHWLREIPFKGLDEIEEVGQRVVVMRNWGVTRGASRLGISHVALSRWARRRKIPS